MVDIACNCDTPQNGNKYHSVGCASGKDVYEVGDEDIEQLTKEGEEDV